MRTITPLPLALTAASALSFVTLATAELTLAAAGLTMPIALRAWLIGLTLATTLITSMVILARWIVHHIEASIVEECHKQVQAVWSDPECTTTIRAAVAPQMAALGDYIHTREQLTWYPPNPN